MKITISEVIKDDPKFLMLRDYLVCNGIIFEVLEVGSDAFKCSVCGKGFVMSNSLDCHMASKHPPTEYCKFCDVPVKQRDMGVHLKGKKHKEAVNRMKYKDIKVYIAHTESDNKIISDDFGNR